ncbi:MAG: hypothetical protein PHF00_09025 [Elusimicrobia bacterium]|nr:hypothetical protein [Elusimicrobiota bacterium]
MALALLIALPSAATTRAASSAADGCREATPERIARSYGQDWGPSDGAEARPLVMALAGYFSCQALAQHSPGICAGYEKVGKTGKEAESVSEICRLWHQWLGNAAPLVKNEKALSSEGPGADWKADACRLLLGRQCDCQEFPRESFAWLDCSFRIQFTNALIWRGSPDLCPWPLQGSCRLLAKADAAAACGISRQDSVNIYCDLLARAETRAKLLELRERACAASGEAQFLAKKVRKLAVEMRKVDGQRQLLQQNWLAAKMREAQAAENEAQKAAAEALAAVPAQDGEMQKTVAEAVNCSRAAKNAVAALLERQISRGSAGKSK